MIVRMASQWSYEKRVDFPSFFLNMWDMKECEKEEMMMFVRMGGGAMGIMRS
jgi:hypothetical protein